MKKCQYMSPERDVVHLYSYACSSIHDDIINIDISVRMDIEINSINITIALYCHNNADTMIMSTSMSTSV